jgi:hypothetical protein
MRPPIGRLLLFASPTLAGLAGRALKGGWWLNDFDAVACAAWRSAHDLPLYAQGLACPGGRPAAYVYAPQWAWMLAPWADEATITPLRAAYGCAYLMIMAWMAWALFWRETPGASRRDRAPLLALSSGSAVACGNLAGPCHAAVLAAGLAGWSWGLIPVILAVAALKPVYLTYLLIFLYADAPWRQRAVKLGAGIAGATALGALIVLTGGTEIEAWRASLSAVVVDQQTGVGFLDAVARLGQRAGDPAVIGLWCVFAGLLSLSGLALVEVRRAPPEARLMVALAIAQLCNPRLMDYDLVMLAGGVAVIADGRPRLQAIMLGVCSLCLVLSLADQTAIAIRLGPALLAGLVLIEGWRAGRDGALGRAFREAS